RETPCSVTGAPRRSRRLSFWSFRKVKLFEFDLPDDQRGQPGVGHRRRYALRDSLASGVQSFQLDGEAMVPANKFLTNPHGLIGTRDWQDQPQGCAARHIRLSS